MKSVVILTSLLCFYTVSCTDNSENCTTLKFSISQNVENEGFHRKINWLLESLNVNDSSYYSNCKMSLQLDVPAGMFVNPDEIMDLRRLDLILAYIIGDVDIESPAHESVGHTVYVFLPDTNLEKISVQLPIHLRYQRAVIAGGFGRVNLPLPSLLIYCPESDIKICGNNLKVNSAPCDVTGDALCLWQNITYQALFEEVQLFVPIGDLDDYPLVAIVTLLLGCAGSVYILSLLSSAPL